MIEVRDMVIDFGGGPVLDKISFTVNEGETAVVLGKNGSGKSVLLKTLIGLISPTSGTVSVGGISPKKMLYGSERPFEMGYVFQKGGLFDSQNVFDNVAFPLRRRKMPEREIETAVLSVIERVGLAGSEMKFPSELSGGMQKRVGLARAVCTNPSIVLYDDPTAGLDPVLSDSIAELMLSLRTGNRVTSLVVTHDLKVAEKIADTVLLIYGGKIVFSGTSTDFFSRSSDYARQFCEGEIEGPMDIY